MLATPVSLLRRLREQSEQQQAWERFVRLYTPLLCAWAARLGLREADIADLVQDIFTHLLQKLPEFDYDPQKSFRGWLRTVALNKWRERQRRWQPPRAELAVENLAAEPADDFWDHEGKQFLLHQAMELIRAEYQPETWTAFWEYAVQGRPAAEVAAELKLTVNAVYLAKARVLRRLKQEFQELLD
jgi:RNA polymerase sigma-70 factor (ECF subfamily)